MFERFSSGKGSPWIWSEKVNCGSTGKAAGTWKKQNHLQYHRLSYYHRTLLESTRGGSGIREWGWRRKYERKRYDSLRGSEGTYCFSKKLPRCRLWNKAFPAFWAPHWEGGRYGGWGLGVGAELQTPQLFPVLILKTIFKTRNIFVGSTSDQSKTEKQPWHS